MGGNWTALSQLTAMIMTPLRGQVDTAIAALFPPVLDVVRASMVIWLAFLGYRIAIGSGENDALGTMLRGFIWVAVVAACITASAYHDWIVEPALTMPQEVATALSGASPDAGAAFDQALGRMWVGGLRVLSSISGWSFLSPAGVAIAVVVVLYWAAGAVTVFAAFGTWLAAQMALYLLLAIGPLFLPPFLFPFFRGYFHRFIGVLISVIVLDILVTSMLTLMLATEVQFLETMRTAGDSTDPFAGAQSLLAALAVFVVMAWLLKQIPGLAATLAGGAYLQAATPVGSVVSAVASPVQAATRGGAASAASAAGAGQIRFNSPPGRAL